ncbi:golgin subfamily A member 6-like protein 6 isoform X2 [Physella acuta]|nr:golgin subfamily A member 6-like protein 6 isoform X2 [Physella acuta]XP_059160254.1 golgin subfamily A member 6-like protein 6 isoform X2 [Physella acuta]XP_059160255.1 golgin subfamily A member 6-like protein 6 isoform X2 [Physella acuta]XP_059160256.1 golgin subfamily A member 6-like protein 6 isoform X2 [Physella acuta]
MEAEVQSSTAEDYVQNIARTAEVVIPQTSQKSSVKNKSSKINMVTAGLSTNNKSSRKLKDNQNQPQSIMTQSNEVWSDEKGEGQGHLLSLKAHSEQERRREDMERQLREAEAELASMSQLLDQREKKIKEAEDAAIKQHDQLQQALVDQEKTLIKHGVDPVTGEKIPKNSDEQGEAAHKFSKKKIQEMKEKLRKMNEQTELCLANLEKSLSDISSLESASVRARSPETEAMLQTADLDVDLVYQAISASSKTLTADAELNKFTQEKFGSHFFLTNDMSAEG